MKNDGLFPSLTQEDIRKLVKQKGITSYGNTAMESQIGLNLSTQETLERIFVCVRCRNHYKLYSNDSILCISNTNDKSDIVKMLASCVIGDMPPNQTLIDSVDEVVSDFDDRGFVISRNILAERALYIYKVKVNHEFK